MSKRCGMFLVASLMVLMARSAPDVASAQEPGRGGAGRSALVSNERVTVMRLTAAAGLVEKMHITPQDVVAIQTAPGPIEMQIGKETTPGSTGKVWYLPKTIEHALYNRGMASVDMLVVMLANEESSATARSQTQGDAGAGTTGALVDNERVSVTRVLAPVGMKQEMHKSPHDLVAIQSTPGQIEMALGAERTAGGPWAVWYLPRTLDHAVFNTGTTPVDMIVITLK